jgi:hypothetical protein
VLGTLAPLLLLYGTITLLRRCPQLAAVHPREPEPWPMLSIIIAACNEAETIEPAMKTLLAEGYPNLEVVLVDDRSTDGTSELVDRIAAEDSRVTPVHVETLPDGWLGKVHALQKGVERARGAWLLFTDADVHFAPGMLRRAVGHGEEKALDHVAVLPEIPLTNFWVGICVGSAVRAIFALARPWEAMDPRSDKAMGTGAFNLVRRAAFDRTPGFEWLRMEVADDIGLALMMKRSGAKPALLLGREMLSVAWYTTLGGAIRGLEKNGFAQAARFSLTRALLMALLTLIGSFGPFAGFIPVGVPWLWMVSAFSLAVFVMGAIVVVKASGTPISYALLSLPLGDVIMAFIILRATVLGIRRGGLVWRGTVYPTAALKKGRRVDM